MLESLISSPGQSTLEELIGLCAASGTQTQYLGVAALRRKPLWASVQSWDPVKQWGSLTLLGKSYLILLKSKSQIPFILVIGPWAERKTFNVYCMSDTAGSFHITLSYLIPVKYFVLSPFTMPQMPKLCVYVYVFKMNTTCPSVLISDITTSRKLS